MKKSIVFIALAIVVFVGCGSNSREDPFLNRPVLEEPKSTLPTLKTPDEVVNNSLGLSVLNSNITKGQATVQINSVLNEKESDISSSVLYDSHVIKSLDTGDVSNGTISLNAGKHIIQICTSLNRVKCSEEEIIIVGNTIDTSLYTKLSLEDASYGLSNNGVDIIYGTKTGLVYSLNISTQSSTFIADTSEQTNGLFYTSSTLYYSTIPAGNIISFSLNDNTKKTLNTVVFPDGLDLYNGKFYSVTNDRSGILSIFDTNGKPLSTLNTNIDDITGITHSSKFLYILSEDGDIYQTNASTGKSSKVFSNAGLFAQGNSVNGLEAITLLDNRLYVSYINDNSVYLIDIDVRDYE